MGISLWLVEGVPMRVTWMNPMRMSLSKWMDSMRNEWIEVNRTIWCEMSEWMDLTLWTLWQGPYGRVKVNPMRVTWVNLMGISLWDEWRCPYQNDLSKSENECPYQNEWIQWEMNEVKWIEWNEWFEGFDLEQPYGKVPMVDRRCPYESDLNEPYKKVPIKMNGIDENWVNRVKWSEMMDLMDLTLNPFKVTWVNLMGIFLWSSESVPIKVTWCEWKWMSLSKWMESMRFELE